MIGTRTMALKVNDYRSDIVAGVPNRTALAAARDDIGLIIDILTRYQG